MDEYIAMVDDQNSYWYYLDMNFAQKGPFKSEQMQKFLDDGRLKVEYKVRPSTSNNFVDLTDLISQNGGSSPFIPHPLPIPVDGSPNKSSLKHVMTKLQLFEQQNFLIMEALKQLNFKIDTLSKTLQNTSNFGGTSTGTGAHLSDFCAAQNVSHDHQDASQVRNFGQSPQFKFYPPGFGGPSGQWGPGGSGGPGGPGDQRGQGVRMGSSGVSSPRFTPTLGLPTRRDWSEITRRYLDLDNRQYFMVLKRENSDEKLFLTLTMVDSTKQLPKDGFSLTLDAAGKLLKTLEKVLDLVQKDKIIADLEKRPAIKESFLSFHYLYMITVNDRDWVVITRDHLNPNPNFKPHSIELSPTGSFMFVNKFTSILDEAEQNSTGH